MIVRTATLDDAKGIILVWQAAFAEKVKPATVMSKIGVADHVTLVAEEDGVVHGFVIVYRNDAAGRWRLDYIAAHPLDAPKGTAYKLLVEAERIAEVFGMKSMFLAVRRKNVHAQRFYERAGWVVIEERPGGFSYEKKLGTYGG